MIDTRENGPEIKRDQVQRPPDLTDDTLQHRKEEAIFGLSVPIMITIVGAIFLLVIIVAVLATR